MVILVEPSFDVEQFDADVMMARIERAGRTCYKSEDKIVKGSAEKFVKMIIERGHESVLEHEKVTVRVMCDRGVSHEIVRHRIASYSQESTRYCNYAKKDQIEVIDIRKHMPEDRKEDVYDHWFDAMVEAECAYMSLIDSGMTPQIARSVLPNSLKTEIVITMNLREWRHFFRLRCARAAHPQMREIAIPLLKFFWEKLPAVFGDIEVQL